MKDHSSPVLFLISRQEYQHFKHLTGCYTSDRTIISAPTSFVSFYYELIEIEFVILLSLRVLISNSLN